MGIASARPAKRAAMIHVKRIAAPLLFREGNSTVRWRRNGVMDGLVKEEEEEKLTQHQGRIQGRQSAYI